MDKFSIMKIVQDMLFTDGQIFGIKHLKELILIINRAYRTKISIIEVV